MLTIPKAVASQAIETQRLTQTWPRCSRVATGSIFLAENEGTGKMWEQTFSTLIEWGRNPSQFEDEIEAPSNLAIRRAYDAAKLMQGHEEAQLLPDWVVPSGDGGIYFRWGTPGDFLLTVKFASDGSVERILTKNCQVVEESRH